MDKGWFHIISHSYISCLLFQDLTLWLSNTWRALAPIQGQARQTRVTRSNFIWLTRRDEVLEEIANLLGLETADTFTPGWFGKRPTAIRNIYSKMSDAEKKKLEVDLESASNKGYPEVTRRRYVLKIIAGNGGSSNGGGCGGGDTHSFTVWPTHILFSVFEQRPELSGWRWAWCR